MSASSARGLLVTCVQSNTKDPHSSGLFQVKVYNTFAYAAGAGEHGIAERHGTSMFPGEVVQKPLPPLVGRLLPRRASGRGPEPLPGAGPVDSLSPCFSGACLCAFQRSPAKRTVHQQVYLHAYPKELMLRNHV